MEKSSRFSMLLFRLFKFKYGLATGIREGELVMKMYLYSNKYAKKYKKVWMKIKYVVCLQNQCYKNDI